MAQLVGFQDILFSGLPFTRMEASQECANVSGPSGTCQAPEAGRQLAKSTGPQQQLAFPCPASCSVDLTRQQRLISPAPVARSSHGQQDHILYCILAKLGGG